MKRAALYLRVSTLEQTTENQRIELEAVAKAKAWTVVQTYEDHGISGAQGRNKRPAYDKMLNDAVRSKFDVVMSWDVSRLGRSLPDLVQSLEDMHANRVDLYLHQQAIDTTTPSGKALFQMCAVFAEFERSIISERVKAGLARSREQGTVLGRPRKMIEISKVKALRDQGHSLRSIAEIVGHSVGSIHAAIRELER